MKAAQFIRGIINGIADSYESSELLQILPADKLASLWDLDREGTYPRVFLNEKVIAKTVVTKAPPDELGRDGTINHTVLYRFDNVIEHDGIYYQFPTEHFEKAARSGKYNFHMPPFPELKRPLDTPPPLEL